MASRRVVRGGSTRTRLPLRSTAGVRTHRRSATLSLRRGLGCSASDGDVAVCST
jgi:hypothetical protein